MPSADKITLKTAVHHHYVRTIVSSLFGFVALALIIVSILVVWLNRTITNTDQYTKTVAPLVKNPDIQAFAVEKASDALINNDDAPIQDIAGELLGQPQIAGKTDDQLRVEVTPIVKDSLKSVIASPSFATLWETNNSTIHAELISQLKSNSSTLELNFHPLITGTIDQLGATKLGFVKDKLELKDDAGKVELTEDKLDTVRKVYDYFQKAMIALIALAAAFFAMCVMISVHHLKTIRRIALLTGIFSAILASVLSATSLVSLGGKDVVQQKFIIALINGVTHDLRLALIIIAVVGIGGSIGSKVYAVVNSNKTQKPGQKPAAAKKKPAKK